MPTEIKITVDLLKDLITAFRTEGECEICDQLRQVMISKLDAERRHQFERLGIPVPDSR